MARHDLEGALYGADGGVSDIAAAARASAAAGGGVRINALLLQSPHEPADAFSSWNPDGMHVDLASAGRAVVSVDGRDGHPFRVAIVGDAERQGVHYALSDCLARDFNDLFASRVTRRVPAFSKTHLSNSDMRSAVGAAGADSDVEIRFASTRLRRAGGRGFDTVVRHVALQPEKFFGGLAGDAEIRTLRFTCLPRGLRYGARAARPGALTVARDGRFSALHDAGALFEAVLPQAADLAVEKGARMRASTDAADERTPEPLIVNFGRKIFGDPAKNRDHVRAIASMPHATINTYHMNPYIHVSLADFNDCSTYDVWILKDDRIAIVPRLFASTTSMARVVNHMLEKFGDGRIERYERGVACE